MCMHHLQTTTEPWIDWTQNTALQQKLRNADVALASNQTLEGYSQDERATLRVALERSHESTKDLDAEVTRLRSELFNEKKS